MTSSSQFFLAMVILCLGIQGFFAMLEMACVSFNKVRLQYYVSHGNRRAKSLRFLLHHPALLFGTTLIGVNTALIVGSECSRRFYDSLNLSPDWAPLSQVFLVIIFAEIAPMFAGRRYAEHVAMLGVPVLFFFSIVLRPVIWALDCLCRYVNRLLGHPVTPGAYLSREELQNLIEEREETFTSDPSKQQFNTIIANIFSLKNKSAKDLMQSISYIPIVPSFCSVAEMREMVQERRVSYLPIYHRDPHNIVAVAYPRDLLRLTDNKRIKDYARVPWFIVEHTSILQILKQFRRNNQSLAIVLNEKGLATGVLTLDEIVDEIFGRSDGWMSYEGILPRAYHVVVDKTFSGDMRLDAFNRQFQIHLKYHNAKTLGELMTQALGHTPTKGESVRIDQFELTVEEASLLGAKTILVRTVV